MYVSTWADKRDEILTIAEQVKLRHPDAWEELKVPHQKSRRFINLVSLAGLAAGLPIGVNLKRGGPEESIDAIALPNATGAMDSTRRYAGLEIVDIVLGAEGPNPSLTWGDATPATLQAGVAGGWKAGTLMMPVPKPAPCPGVARNELRDFFDRLNLEYRMRGRKNRTLDGGEELYIDNEGVYVWLPEFIRHRQQGMDVAQATRAVMDEIARVWH